MNSNKRIFVFILLLLSKAAFAQKDANFNSAEIKEAIRKLNVLGSVLYIAAHPDDENTRLITYFSKEKLYNTAYISLTRGDGGQNLIGQELNELLGVIRTQELLEARKIDGGKQFFSRARDFGFSKNPTETFEVWDKEQTLADMVWVIRKFQPDVLITRFNTEPGKTHGHHTASALLALEAFDISGDPNRFPEQLAFVKPWKAKRILWNTNSWFYPNADEFKAISDTMLKIDVGTYNTTLGQSYTEIAACSRSMHKSQGFGAAGVRGSSMEYLQHYKGPKASKNLFEGIDTTWNRVAPNPSLIGSIDKLYQSFNPTNPTASIAQLLEIRKQISAMPNENNWKEIKLKEVDQIIKSCLGLWIEVTAQDYSAVPGESMKLSTELINRSSVPLTIKSIQFFPGKKDTVLNQAMVPNVNVQFSNTILLAKDLAFSQPYWLVNEGSKGMFKVNEQEQIGLPENPPVIVAKFNFLLNDVDLNYSIPVVYKKVDPVKAELYRPFELTPTVFINPLDKQLIFADSKPKKIRVKIKAGRDKAKGNLFVEVPTGWKVEPAKIPFSLSKKGNEETFELKVYPSSQAVQTSLKIKAQVGNDTISSGLTSIAYDHIANQDLFPASDVKLIRLNLKKKGKNIGFIMGAGDELSSSLQQIGYDVTMLNEKAVNAESLKNFDAILIGIRAFNVNDKLPLIHPALLQYVKNGGTLVVQYNTVPNRVTANVFVTDSIGPYSFKLSNERVTKEDAEVRILNPEHPLLNYPNKITTKDFDNWVQERGLYFPNEWSKQYQTIVSFNDPGETPKDGSILYATYGKGVFIYTSLSWFRQLPAGVPGAFRLFVNLLSAKK